MIRLKPKKSVAKNAIKFKGEVPISEFENKEDKSASENAKTLKKKMIEDEISEKGKVEKQSSTWPIPRGPRDASC